MTYNHRIEICGGIASGKTTFASLLSKIGFDPIYENFQSNPFWEVFFAEPLKYNFETEVCFMLQHYHQIKKIAPEVKKIACDYSFLLDTAYAEIGLSGSQLDTFMAVQKEINDELPPPSLIIHLECDAQTELTRIRKRARSVEVGIDEGFLDSLNNAVADQVKKARNHSKVITIDSVYNNFASDGTVQEELLRQVSDSIK